MLPRTNRRAQRPSFDLLDVRCLPSTMPVATPFASVVAQPDAGAGSPRGGLTPAQVRQAYGLNQVDATGLGQTIAIVDAFHDPNIQSDLNTFSAQFGLPTTALQIRSLTAGVDSGWSLEEALDVEWAHALAPYAQILVVEAKSASISDLMSAVNVARNTPGVSVVSMSWGGAEFRGETAFDSYFNTPGGHTGISFVVATGDDIGLERGAVAGFVAGGRGGRRDDAHRGAQRLVVGGRLVPGSAGGGQSAWRRHRASRRRSGRPAGA